MKEYEKPEIEIIYFDDTDIIATSAVDPNNANNYVPNDNTFN